MKNDGLRMLGYLYRKRFGSKIAKVWNQEYFTSVGRKLQDTFDCSKNSESRKPNSSPPLLSSFTTEITTPYLVSLQFHHHIHSRAANRIHQCTSFALLQERILHDRRELDKNNTAKITQKKAYIIQNMAKVRNQE
jgi:hypothetical protein